MINAKKSTSQILSSCAKTPSKFIYFSYICLFKLDQSNEWLTTTCYLHNVKYKWLRVRLYIDAKCTDAFRRFQYVWTRLCNYNLPSCSYNRQDVIIRSIELIIAAFVFNREKLISLVSRSSTWDRKIKMIMSKIERLILYYALNIPKCFFFAKLINSDLYCCARPPRK